MLELLWGNFEQLSSYGETSTVDAYCLIQMAQYQLEVNEGIISRFNTSGGLYAISELQRQDGTVFEDALYSFESN
jgi:hypothetical protein